MRQFEELEYDQFHHINNHYVGGRDVFRDANNYEYFLDLYDKYRSPLVETYAWILMKIQLHFLIRFKP
jgi:putative transposase